ncbi:MAG: hypothetical protein C4558_08035 [Dehalococcoidia bacterium]|nr:MAG: hypothetical protein C4558_08035 [Dehalococcoidia bacterium]
MDHVTITILFLIAALAVFFAEIFVPSGGILFVVGMCFLAMFVMRMFSYSQAWGYAALVGSLIGVPGGAIFIVRNLDRLPFGRKLIPPNPDAPSGEAAAAHPELAALVGRTGRTLTPLRPVGTCEFDGRRVQCVAETGSIESGHAVVADCVRMNELVVRPAQG